MPTKRYSGLLAGIVNAVIGPFVTSTTSGRDGRDGRRVRELFGRLLDSDLGDLVIASDSQRELASWDAASVAASQRELRGLLLSLVRLRDSEDGGIVPQFPLGDLAIAPIPNDARIVLAIDGAARDLVRYKFLQLLGIVGTEQLRRCAAGDCGRIFIKVGRREYCSNTCQKRTYMRERRQRGQDTARRRHVTARKK